MKASRILMPGIHFLVYSNIFIALCASAYTSKTSLLLYGNKGSLLVNTFVFSATLLFYCFHRMNKMKFLTSDENKEDRNNWMSSHKTIYYVFIAISFIALLVESIFMPLRTWIVFIPPALLGLGYTFPVIPTATGRKRLRDIYWLKTFWIAFAFAWLTTLLPVLFIQPLSAILQPPVIFTFCRCLLFIFAICVPFDIRDMNFDTKKGVHTLPVMAGARTSVYMAVTLLLFFISLICIQFLYFNLEIRYASALFISAFLTIVLLGFTNSKRPALFYPLLFDGAMLVQWLLVFAFAHF